MKNESDWKAFAKSRQVKDDNMNNIVHFVFSVKFDSLNNVNLRDTYLKICI